MRESEMCQTRQYDPAVKSPKGKDSPGPKYKSQWAIDDSRFNNARVYSIPKEKRELKFNSANWRAKVGPADYATNYSSINETS